MARIFSTPPGIARRRPANKANSLLRAIGVRLHPEGHRVSQPTVIDFLDGRSLLGPHYAGVSWDRWRAVLRATFALPMTAGDLALFNEVAGGRAPPKKPVRTLVSIVGRGGGKDSIAAALATFVACTGDFRRLRAGEKAVVLCLAVDRQQARIVFGYIRAFFEEIPALRGLVGGKIGDDQIKLRTGAQIKVATNSFRSVRGWTICCAIYDEVAFWWSEDYANPDVEVDTAVSPGLMRFPGSLKILISSANRRAGLLYDNFAECFGKDDDDTLVVLGESLQFNPTLDAKEIERLVERDPEKAGAEYLSRWRDDLTSFLDRQLVDAAIEEGIVSRPPKPGTTYTAFADPSGGRGDSFTAAIGHAERNILVIDTVYERRAPFDSEATITDVATLAKQYGVSTIRGDDYGADLVVAAFRRHGITYRNLRLTDADGNNGKLNRSEIYLNAIGLFTAGRIRLPDNPRLVHQLISLERRASRSSGHDTVDHPAGGHDDLANAACGCLVALAGKPAPLILTSKQLRQVAALPPRDRFSRSSAMPHFSPHQLGLR
jgi:hypothetical protein